MSKAIRLTINQWNKIERAMRSDPRIPKSATLIRNKMREYMGFTARTHKEFVPKMDGGHYVTQIHLDFYNESKRTLFLLRYSDFLNEEKEITY